MTHNRLAIVVPETANAIQVSNLVSEIGIVVAVVAKPSITGAPKAI